MANRLNQQSPQLRLKDSIKKEMSRINRDTQPLHCYSEVTKLLKDRIRSFHYSDGSISNFSVDDVIKYQNNKYYKTSDIDFDAYEKYMNSLTEEQNTICYFNKYYDIDNESFYEKKLCSGLYKLPKDVEICIEHLYLSLSWYNDEMEKLNNPQMPEINENKKIKKIKKIIEYLQEYKDINNKYSAFLNKIVVDLIHLYNKYSESHSIESIIHNLVVLSSLMKKQDRESYIDGIITEIYKKHIKVLDFKILSTLFLCSLTVKTLIFEEIGETRWFVMEKIIPNDKLKQMFFVSCDDNS